MVTMNESVSVFPAVSVTRTVTVADPAKSSAGFTSMNRPSNETPDDGFVLLVMRNVSCESLHSTSLANAHTSITFPQNASSPQPTSGRFAMIGAES